MNALSYFLPMILGVAAFYGGCRMNDLVNYWNGTLYWKWRYFWESERGQTLRMNLINGALMIGGVLLFAALMFLLDYLGFWRGNDYQLY